MSDTLTRLHEDAPAKINLSLQVVGLREDGYHLLDSLVIFAGIGDRLTAEPAQGLELVIQGPFGGGLTPTPDNLVLRAAHALAAHTACPKGARLTLEKNLPVASGIGGGSADAAATLRVLARLWGLTVPHNEMLHLAARLGADVPVCLAGQATRMRGIGDQLDPVPSLPDFGLLLVNPGVAVSTQAVFKARTGAPSAAMPGLTGQEDLPALIQWLQARTNDLQPPAQNLCPDITATLHAISKTPSCLLARMSGSGATCFGLYPTAQAAQQAATALARPGWWCWGGAVARSSA